MPFLSISGIDQDLFKSDGHEGASDGTLSCTCYGCMLINSSSLHSLMPMSITFPAEEGNTSQQCRLGACNWEEKYTQKVSYSIQSAQC